MCRCMCGETNPTNLPLLLQLTYSINQVTLLPVIEQPIKMIVSVKSMYTEQIDIVNTQCFYLLENL